MTSHGVSASAALRQRLHAGIEAATARAMRDGQAVVVSACEPVPCHDPLDALLAAPTELASEGRMYWAQPDQGFALAGVGAAATVVASGPGRFGAVERAWSDLTGSTIPDDVAPRISGVGPTLMGGFAFHDDGPRSALWRDFPGARMVLPRVQLARVNGECWLTLNVVVARDGLTGITADALLSASGQMLISAGEAPLANRGPAGAEVTFHDRQPVGDWCAAVADGARAVRDGVLEKVVLARELRAHSRHELDPAAALGALRSSHPACYIFCIWSGASVFLGASPELLAGLSGDEVRVSCLAGSAGRGATVAEDRARAAALLASAKNRTEHAVVLDALRRGLATCCDDVRAECEPTLRTFAEVQHLYTAVRARLRSTESLLSLVSRLHPTPAVGGAPRAGALLFIREHEGTDRGWYAAPVGWIGAEHGAFAVALRCALLQGGTASLWAGCGIVGDSEPGDELAESELKLRAMEHALTSAAWAVAPACDAEPAGAPPPPSAP